MTSLWIESILVVVQGVLVAIDEESGLIFIFNIVLCILGFVAWAFVSSLFFFHIYLSIINQTTN